MRIAAILLALAIPAAASAQMPDSAALIAAQREAMARMPPIDGIWRGPAWTIMPGGRHEVIQTERIGSFLGGTLKVIEGRGYSADGSVGFNAMGIVSFNPATKTYSMRSYAMGHSGDFPFRPTADGYVWEVPAGPGAIIRYTATVKDGKLREVGERIVAGQPPMQIFEMNLERVADTDWPAGNPVPMR